MKQKEVKRIYIDHYGKLDNGNKLSIIQIINNHSSIPCWFIQEFRQVNFGYDLCKEVIFNEINGDILYERSF